jgi:2-alkyl-3-oxoalkanoate reductase
VSHTAPRTIAVTGSSGFLGGAVARHLLAAGHEVLCFGQRDRDLVSPDLRERYRSWNIGDGPLADAPDVAAVVHCAGKVTEWGHFRDFERINVLGTRNVVATWPAARFVHISTASVYDDHQAGTLHEWHADPTDRAAIDRASWLSPYAHTKRLAEHEVATRAGDWAILRPHLIYGPDDSQLSLRLLERVRFGRLLVPGNGRARRVSTVHIDNLVHAVDLALDSRESGAFNVVDAVTPTVHEVLTATFAALGVPVRLTYLPREPMWALSAVIELAWKLLRVATPPPVHRFTIAHLAWDHVLDTTRARELLGFRPALAYPESFATISIHR